MSDAFRLLVPAPYTLGTGTPGANSFVLNGTTDQLEFIFAADDGVAITRLGFRQGTLTGTAPVFRVSLQGVDGTGIPDGTIKSSSNAFADYTPTAGNNNTWQWVTLGASYTPGRGEVLAMVIAYQSGTIDGSNNCTFGSTVNGVGGSAGFPYTIQNDAGARTRQTNNIPLWGYGSSSRAYGHPLQTGNSLTVSSTTSPDEVGLLFTLPAGWGQTDKVLGLNFMLNNPAAATFNLTLYDTDGTTVLQQVTHDTDQLSGGSPRPTEVLFDEASLTALNFGSAYRLAIAPVAAVNHFLHYVEMAAAADLDALPGGQNIGWTERTDAGGWTDRPARRMLAEIILADWTKPAASGGVNRALLPAGVSALG